MPSIYIRDPLPPGKLMMLREEFHPYTFLTQCQTPEEWGSVEILYGSELSEEELELATRLKWIHSPHHHLESICFDAIVDQKDVILTLSPELNVAQMSEFVLGAILAFAKQFFLWPLSPHEPTEFWDWPLKETMWSLHERTLLQIGLEEIGMGISKLAKSVGVRIWGMKRTPSFHPHCKKTFAYSNLHPLLPAVDIVVLSLPIEDQKLLKFGKKEFELMKKDSILIIIGSGFQYDEQALAEVAGTGKFRGILIDGFAHPESIKESPLWNIPNAILTPSVAKYPKTEKKTEAFNFFRKNLRLFIPGKVSEMKHRILI